MALHFVKTAVLSSSDGVDFGTEVAVESDETRKAKLDAEAATRKPLFQQLADLRDKKQEEFDDNKKKIFAPPKSLDDDDVEFFDDLERKRSRAMEARNASEERALEGFRSARTKGNQLEDVDAAESGAPSKAAVDHNSGIFIPPRKAEESAVRPVLMITKRRKIEKGKGAETVSGSSSSSHSTSAAFDIGTSAAGAGLWVGVGAGLEVQGGEDTVVDKRVEVAAAVNPMAMLGGYDSEED